MTPLHISARTFLKTYGDQFCTDRLFINYLSDYSRFEPEALKNIMSIIVNEGYARGLVDTKFKRENWSVYTSDAISKIEKQYGFEHKYVSYCFQCLCYGLQLTDHVDESIINTDNTWAPQTPYATNNQQESANAFQQESASTHQQSQFQPRNGIGAQRASQNARRQTQQQTRAQSHYPFQSFDISTFLTNRKVKKLMLIGFIAFIFLLIAYVVTISKIANSSYESSSRLYQLPYSLPDVDLDDLDSPYYTDSLDDLDDYDEDDLYGGTALMSDSILNAQMDSIMMQDYDSIIREVMESSQRESERVMSEINQMTQDINRRVSSSSNRTSPTPPPSPPVPTSPTDENDMAQTEQSAQPAQRESRTRQLRRRANEYYQRAKQRVIESLDIDEDEMKERWDETKEELKERWGELKEDILDGWHNIRNR